jgi:hypothetical protein
MQHLQKIESPDSGQLFAQIQNLVIRNVKLPRYAERDRNGNLSFRVDRGARIPLPNDPTTPEFRAAYNAALVGAIAAESDDDDWSELEAMHRAQRLAKFRRMAIKGLAQLLVQDRRAYGAAGGNSFGERQ